jgi:hypothetical protein
VGLRDHDPRRFGVRRLNQQHQRRNDRPSEHRSRDIQDSLQDRAAITMPRGRMTTAIHGRCPDLLSPCDKAAARRLQERVHWSEAVVSDIEPSRYQQTRPFPAQEASSPFKEPKLLESSAVAQGSSRNRPTVCPIRWMAIPRPVVTSRVKGAWNDHHGRRADPVVDRGRGRWIAV